MLDWRFQHANKAHYHTASSSLPFFFCLFALRVHTIHPCAADSTVNGFSLLVSNLCCVLCAVCCVLFFLNGFSVSNTRTNLHESATRSSFPNRRSSTSKSEGYVQKPYCRLLCHRTDRRTHTHIHTHAHTHTQTHMHTHAHYTPTHTPLTLFLLLCAVPWRVACVPVSTAPGRERRAPGAGAPPHRRVPGRTPAADGARQGEPRCWCWCCCCSLLCASHAHTRTRSHQHIKSCIHCNATGES